MQGKEIFEAYESEVRSYCRSFPTVFTTAKGSIITDSEGKEYIDFFNGAGALNYGHNNDYIKVKLIDYLQSDGIIHSLDMMTTPKAEFIQFFEEKVLQPRGLNYKIMFPGPTGTNGIEAALKLARKVTKRSEVWALMGCFHGMTLGALSLTSDSGSRGGAGVKLENVTHIPAPYMFPELDTIKYMETLLTDDHSGVDKPAAIIIETVQAEGGVQVFSVEWLKALQELCHKHEIIFIVDDIQVGCARTGTYFSFERAGIVPDITVLSKSIGGYGMPLALTLFKPELDVWTPGEHNGTFRGNQLSIVAAKAGLEYMLNEHIEAEVKRKEAIVSEKLTEAVSNKAPKALSEGEIKLRGIGLIWGVEVKDGKTALAIANECFKNGLIIERAGRDNNVVKLMPALTIPDDILLKGIEILGDAIGTVLA